MRRAWSSRGATLAIAASLLALGGRARGDGLSLYLEPNFTGANTQTTFPVGPGVEQDTKSLTQNYRLNFDRLVGPALTVSAGGFYEGRRQWSTDAFGSSTTDAALRGLFARLTLGMPVLSGGLSYDLASQSPAASSNPLVGQNFTAYVSWLPDRLPELNLRLNWNQQQDAARLTTDVTTWTAQGSARWIVDPFEFRYFFQWARPKDGISGTEASAINQSLQGIYSDRIFAGRTALYVNVSLRNQMTTVLSAGSGTISQQQHPVAGLSLVEVPPAVPTTVTLAPNPALIDGNLTQSASVDLGYAPSLAGDSNNRDLGMQFADLVTPVNTIQVWVDRALPPELAVTYTWSAYQSDDNRNWTPVAIAGPVAFGAFQNRFEIPIQVTQARYLKVVTQPMRAGLTVDTAFANVFVTEIQAFLVRPADAVAQDRANSVATLNATASTLLWRAANLSWDLSTTVERRTSPGLTTWSLVNALGASQWLSRTLQINERISRQDGDDGVGHYGQTDWSAGLVWRPLPTFVGSLTYNGIFADARPRFDNGTGSYVVEPVGFTHTLSAFARADLYEGISVLANASSGLQSMYDGTNTWSTSVNALATLTPNPWLTLTLGWLSGWSVRQLPFEDPVPSRTARVDASATVRPTASISAVGTISRVLWGETPATYGSLQLNYSPLRGDLQLYVTYSRTFESVSQSVNELLTPGLRWNLGPGLQITGSYTLLRSDAPVSQSRSRIFNVGLSLLL